MLVSACMDVVACGIVASWAICGGNLLELRTAAPGRHRDIFFLAAQVDQDPSSSAPSMRLAHLPPTRRLVQADAGATDAQDMDVLAVSLPILSFRPSPRSKRRQQATTALPVPDTAQSPLSPALEARVEVRDAAVPVSANEGSAGSSEEDEDWSYPALDLTASRDEAAKRLQSKAVKAAVSAEFDWREESSAPAPEPAVHEAMNSASADEDAASDSSSNHDNWSYPPLQPVQRQRPPAEADERRDRVNGRSSSHVPFSQPEDDKSIQLQRQEQSIASAPSQELSDNVAGPVPGPTIELSSFQSTSTADPAAAEFLEPLHVMYSNAAFNCSRFSTSSHEYDGSTHGEEDDDCPSMLDPTDLAAVTALHTDGAADPGQGPPKFEHIADNTSRQAIGKLYCRAKSGSTPHRMSRIGQGIELSGSSPLAWRMSAILITSR